jgi:hypothetical protein
MASTSILFQHRNNARKRRKTKIWERSGEENKK